MPEAYAQRIPRLVCDHPDCDRPATFQVFNAATLLPYRGHAVGDYCGRHAGEVVHSINHPTTEEETP
jgi:hypothetical protein